MSGAEDTSVGATAWSAADVPAPGAAAPPRGRLFRKYALLFIALVGAALLVTSAFDLWFSYQENKAALVRVQQEKAQAAASRIEEFIGEIERQIGWTTHAQWAAAPLDQRRQDYFRLLRQVPAITELSQLDAAGKEQLKVSRLSMDVIGSGADFSQAPAFKEAKAHRVWFSPVYFRKESEPYMTLAIARDGRNAGVTVAEINLKLIWDVITAMKIGEQGYAYVVDGRGRLIAHPDISLVLRDTDLSRLPQVASALPSKATLSPAGGEGRVRGPAVTVAKNLAGRAVLTAHAAIQPLQWLVFVEVPLREAFAPLYDGAIRTLLLLAFGLGAATLAAVILARRMTGPIRAIAEGAERLGAGELDRRIEIHTGDELEALAGQFNRMAGDLQKSYAELEQRVRDRTAELSEALDQQTATAEVLGVINSSPGDLAPVFDAMLEKAMHLCGAAFGILRTYDGQRFHTAASHGVPPGYAEFLVRNPQDPQPGTIGFRVVETKSVVHLADAMDRESYRSGETHGRALVDLGGARTVLVIPLTKDRALLGAIQIYRQEVRPFSDKQIALLQNFAAQAVIAIENTRLITETREALDQQTATAEVLGVINSSPGDLAPVFDAMLEKALGLCEATYGHLVTFDGEYIHIEALTGDPRLVNHFRNIGPVRPPPESVVERFLKGEDVVHIADTAHDPGSRVGGSLLQALAELGGTRSLLGVALRKDRFLLGGIVVYRQEVRPFGDQQIALLQNFAAQAVIAMENARLITETREALEQQTATAEVLGVINSSPGDLAPVFDAMLEKAMRLCQAAFGMMHTYDAKDVRLVAQFGIPPRFAEFAAHPSNQPGPGGATPRLLGGAPFVHVPDLADEEAYHSGDPYRRALVDIGGARTLLAVPLRKDGVPLGQIGVYRQEVRPFTDKQIALLQNFAAQAVIAMENARLITETREALAQQTATAEVLGVINSSPGDLAPVFDAMLERALHLCQAGLGLLLIYEEKCFRAASLHGAPEAYTAFLTEKPLRPGPDTGLARLIREQSVVHIPDLTADEAYRQRDPLRVASVELAGMRTFLAVPLVKDQALRGAFVVYRREVLPFSDKQIALLQNFAAQAVIAMENARLITETREALEQQTATAEVLQVINSSPGNLAPVFDTMLEKAMRLCEATFGVFWTYDGEFTHAAAIRGATAAYREFLSAPHRPGPGSAQLRLIQGERFVHVADLADSDDYRSGDALPRALVDLGGGRSLLAAPLRKDGAYAGAIMIYHQQPSPFSDKQIALLENFAAQAVIAIENARLLGELRERTDELGRSVEELKALSEVGQAVSSTLELRDVLSTILNRSVALAGADAGAIFRYNRATRVFRFVEAVGYTEAMVRDVRALDVGENVTGLGIAIARRTPLQIPDLRERPANPLRDQAIAAGYRSVLIVPLVGADRVLGATVLQRRTVGEFPEATVRLMQTLAAQSVLAIQNARLFREIAEKSEEVRQASQHKSQFLANMSHELRTPLNAILGYAELLADGIYGELPPRAAGVLERVQNNGKHLLALINDVLDLAKIEAGQLALTLEDYALPDVVQSVVSATESLANNKGLKFTADVAPGLPLGHGDARRLAQVLLNLAGNAIKFTDAGEVAIGAAAENGHFVLTVRDTGPGIAPADQAKIFEEFQQVDNSNTRKKGGTGLGLAISKRMVEMQGGTISVESELGHGATFRVTLPIRVEEVPEELMGAA